MSDEPNIDGSPKAEPSEPVPNKDSVKQFVLRITKPFELDTQGLGVIVARSLTVSASAVFQDRVPSLEDIPDRALVRAYMGCVSGFPVEDKEALPQSLTTDQVASLTEEDVDAFARAYLDKIVKRPENGDAIAEMAVFIRQEREKSSALYKKVAENMHSALKVGAAADIMKNWGRLNESITGPIEKLREEIDKTLGSSAITSIAETLRELQAQRATDPFTTIPPSIGDALRGAEANRALTDAAKALDPLGSMRSSVSDALRGLKTHDALAEAAKKLNGLHGLTDRSGMVDFGRVQVKEFPPLPRIPPVSETPMGRAAIAVERLHEIGGRMESAMTIVVEQAGNVSGQMGEVLEKIEAEAAKSQKATRWAQFTAIFSLVLSMAAFMASAYFSQVGYDADRKDAAEEDKASALVAKRLEEQNALMRELLEQSKKRPNTGAEQRDSVPNAGKGPAPLLEQKK